MHKRFCKWGHEFTPDNTYIRPSDGKRACRICLREKSRKWRKEHPEKTKAVLKHWYEENKERVYLQKLEWTRNNLEKERERKRNWAHTNLEVGRRLARKRRALKKSKLGLWCEFETLLIPMLRQIQQNRCYYCHKLMSLSLPPQHPGREVLEHPLPLSRGGSHGIDNWVLACFECNSSKGNKTAQEFLEK